MQRPANWIRAGQIVLSAALLSACEGLDPRAEGEGEGEAPGRSTFSFEARDDINVPSLWGAIVADGPTPAEAFVIGGMGGDQGPVTDEVQNVRVEGGVVRSSSTLRIDQARYCGCALHDPQRQELVVVGGRDGRFVDVESSFVLDLVNGERTDIADPGPALFPIGCQAAFVDGVAKGYVFSGLSSNRGAFGDNTFVWDPEARTFTALAATGPSPRYDASVHRVDDDSFLMVGGMGLRLGRPVFFSEVWRFDADVEAWVEIPANNSAPAGRRYPWAALGPDDDTLLYGFGSDSPVGDSVLGDLSRFSLSTGLWEEVDVDGELPSARGFTFRLPGPLGSAGVMSGGFDGAGLSLDAFVLQVPDELAGGWR